MRNLTDEDIASFKALGVEVCIASEEIGEVWIVPEYTEQERRELRIDHAATLTAVCATFPGAKVTSFEKLAKPEPRSRPELSPAVFAGALPWWRPPPEASE